MSAPAFPTVGTDLTEALSQAARASMELEVSRKEALLRGCLWRIVTPETFTLVKVFMMSAVELRVDVAGLLARSSAPVARDQSTTRRWVSQACEFARGNEGSR